MWSRGAELKKEGRLSEDSTLYTCGDDYWSVKLYVSCRINMRIMEYEMIIGFIRMWISISISIVSFLTPLTQYLFYFLSRSLKFAYPHVWVFMQLLCLRRLYFIMYMATFKNKLKLYWLMLKSEKVIWVAIIQIEWKVKTITWIEICEY